MSIRNLPLILLIFLFATGCQTTSGTSNISAIEKRQIEQRIMDYPLKIIYGATLAVLVDQGYSIQNSDRAGGLIVAEKFGEKRPWGFVAYDRDIFSSSIILSATSPNQTSVRYTIRKKVVTNMGYGEGVKDVVEVMDPEVSQAFYSLLKTEAERRKAGFN